MARFLRVRNWEKFQHYKDRNPPWIKLHTALLDNYEFASLQDASKLLAVCTWLLAARSDNKIPADPEWIKQRCNLKSKPDLQPLIDGGFLEYIQELQSQEQNASDPLSNCLQDACSLTEERRDRGEADGSASALVLHESLPTEEWEQWLSKRRKKRWPLDNLTLGKQLEVLREYDTPTQRIMLNTSMQAGWQGIFPPKGEPKKKTGAGGIQWA